MTYPSALAGNPEKDGRRCEPLAAARPLNDVLTATPIAHSGVDEQDVSAVVESSDLVGQLGTS